MAICIGYFKVLFCDHSASVIGGARNRCYLGYANHHTQKNRFRVKRCFVVCSIIMLMLKLMYCYTHILRWLANRCVTQITLIKLCCKQNSLTAFFY